ncbi:hypothetical protein BKA70DRAFT_829806 [Coprinopsis sp. MPI-PUGE-AT-0042]|nr:hypothetical protein BKA70DRAFT_829806 [Coprinopsis sp. MPI-PUGE-AT-0042]
MAPLHFGSMTQTLDNTVGAIFLGVIGAGFLFGVNTLQLGYYFHSFPNDIVLHKVSVALLWSLDAVHLALTMYASYTHVVTDFGNLQGLTRVHWSMQAQVTVMVIVIILVHCLYGQRIWKLSGYHRGFLGYITILALGAAAAVGIVLAYKVFTINSYAQLEQIRWALQAGFATATVIDFLITLAMVYYLHKSIGTGSRTKLNTRISVVIQYVMASGLLTSACSIAALVAFVVAPNNFAFLALEFLLTKFYVGSFLALLNARERTQSGTNSEASQSRNRDSYTSLPSPKKRVTSSFWSASVLPTLPVSRNPHTRHAFSPSEETKVMPPYNGPVAL